MRNDGVLRRAKSAKTPLLLLLPRSIKEKTRVRIFVKSSQVKSSQVKSNSTFSARDRSGGQNSAQPAPLEIAPVGKGRRLGSRRVCKTATGVLSHERLSGVIT